MLPSECNNYIPQYPRRLLLSGSNPWYSDQDRIYLVITTEPEGYGHSYNASLTLRIV